MRVYKFRSKKWGIDALIKNHLKVSPLDELNDPFEYLSVNIGDRSLRKFIKDRRNFLGSNGAIISFCANWSNPVIWSHYADSHRGIALGFDIPDNFLFKIQYEDKPLSFNSEYLSDPNKILELFKYIGKTKFKHWEYENEYRLFYDLERSKRENPDDKLFFQPFEPDMQLKEVILGCRYQGGENSALENKLVDNGISISTARPSFTEFKIVKQNKKRLQKNI
ncbi:MAG: DUF2971 domain-containing protein [Notoacmeibacter sp.]|nr:DUF2971 domain-containing protein [Notoacmeibacter sp.]MCC0032999.1 DUF2971 domain-containing protein [Brucellaceae bacterium]